MAVEEKKKEWAVEKKRMIRQGKGKLLEKSPSSRMIFWLASVEFAGVWVV